MFTEVIAEDAALKLKQDRGAEHHLTFTSELGAGDSAVYLTEWCRTLGPLVYSLLGKLLLCWMNTIARTL